MTPVAAAPAEFKLTERINRIEPSATMAVVAEADKLRQQGIDVVDFGAGEPHFATPQHIKDAAINAIQSNFSKYTAVGGTTELRDAIVHRHAVDFDSDYRREETSASVGGKHALFNAIQVLVDHGDEVILPVPYWVSFKDIVRYAGGNCLLLETDEEQGFRVTAEMIERLITPRTRLIILNSPSNPSGAVISPDDLKEVVRLAAERGIWVISDECYVYLSYTGKRFERDAEAAKPIDVEPYFHRAEGSGRSPERSAAVRRRNAPGVHSAARSYCKRLAIDSGHQVHHAGRGVLRVSEHFVLHRSERHWLRFRSCWPAASRIARGDSSGRGFRHPRSHPRFLCNNSCRTGPRLGANAQIPHDIVISRRSEHSHWLSCGEECPTR